jgi:tetraprenyl-beta-curcumene synthase
MSTTAHSRSGHAARGLLPAELYGAADSGRLTRLLTQVELPRAFLETAASYLGLVLPAARHEITRWRTLASDIPDASLRRTAECSLDKRGNMEGAALFATLAPASQRTATIRALVAFQAAYNYLDSLSELPSARPAAASGQLHQALLSALTPEAGHLDYYAEHPGADDGGYLRALIDWCRTESASLPSFEAVAPSAQAAAARIRDFQTLNAEPKHSARAMERWARERLPPRHGLQWWEIAAACGSSLSVHALISAAATPGLDPHDAHQVEEMYFPWADALHSLLDSLVDRREDEDAGLACLLDGYGSSSYAAARLQTLAARATQAAARLHRPQHHRAIAIAMCSYYLSAPECEGAEAAAIHRALTRMLGPTLSAAVIVFRARRAANTLLGRAYN